MSQTLGHNENKNIVDLNEWVQQYLSGSGSEIDELKEAVKNIWQVIYPVGSIYISTSATNPSLIWGGSWVAWGQGRVPVCVNTGDEAFNTVEKVGGNKNLQAHTHNFSASFNVKATGNGNSIWKSVHGTSNNVTITNTPSYTGHMWDQYITTGSRDNTGTAVSINGPTSSTGAGDGQNLQPYITCYMWKRVE